MSAILYVFAIIISFLSSFAFIKIGKPIAEKFGLVDIPGGRKEHQGAIPLIGGIAIFLSVTISSILFLQINHLLKMYLSSAALMLLIGILDDRYDLRVSYRLCFQAFSASLMIFGADVYLTDVGNLFGYGTIELGWFGPFVTLLAVIGAINAFNMMDGIDGLAGTLSIISFVAISTLFYSCNNSWFVLPILFISAVCAYLMFNLGWPKGRLRKIFMGDAGSMVIGLTVVWLLVLGSQQENQAFSPVTALWIIALPLMDMTAIMIRRVRKGQSPFKPDRNHLHHICIRAGLSSRQSLSFISIIAFLLVLMGLAGEWMNLPDWMMFSAFMALFLLYSFSIQHIWKIVKLIRRLKSKGL